MRSERLTVCAFAAVERELAPLRAELDRLPSLFAVHCDATGVGKSSAAAVATERILAVAPDLVLAVGSAGAYPGSGLKVGDVVVAEHEILADEGADGPTGFHDLAELGLPSATLPGGRTLHNEIPLTVPGANLWDHLSSAAAASGFRLVRGRCATVSTASGSAQRARELETRWRVMAESLEGAALALAALRLGRPCCEIRGISNPVGPRDRGAWNIDLACRNVAVVAAELLAHWESPPRAR